MAVRYAARPVEVDPEVQLTQRRIVSKGIDVFYETDPEIIASVLPPPLRPAERPLVRIQIMGVTIGDGELFASGNFTVAAAHGDTEGAYCLFMPQATEPIVVGGRETYGEPKKIADISLERDGDSVRASVARYGATLIDIEGTIGAEQELPPPGIELEYYLKYLRHPSGDGLTDPHLVYCEYDRELIAKNAFDGTLVLGESPVDPVADIEVRNIVSMTWFERYSHQSGFIKERVDGDALLPYVHQKYDDLGAVAELRKQQKVAS